MSVTDTSHIAAFVEISVSAYGLSGSCGKTSTLAAKAARGSKAINSMRLFIVRFLLYHIYRFPFARL